MSPSCFQYSPLRRRRRLRGTHLVQTILSRLSFLAHSQQLHKVFVHVCLHFFLFFGICLEGPAVDWAPVLAQICSVRVSTPNLLL